MLEVYTKIRELADRVEVISFDFFDTLFVRSVIDPEDVFTLVGEKHHISNFKEVRKEAQGKAFQQMHLEGRKEITLKNIYEQMNLFGHNFEELMQTELDIESTLIHPNYELLNIFLELHMKQKNIILISDMYLPKTFFEFMFDKYKLPHIKLFISSEENATKRDFGDLFDIVSLALEIPPHQILHIGDNPVSDIDRAKAKGLKTFHYQEKYIPKQPVSPSIESSISSALFRKISSSISKNTFQELGFIYGGPAAVGFLKWLDKEVRMDNIDVLLFISRDGYILHNIISQCQIESLPKSHYFFASRTAFNMASIVEENFIEHIDFLISGSIGLSISELLLRIGVEVPAESILSLFCTADSKITLENLDLIKSFMYVYRFEILKIAAQNRQALFIYLQSLGIRDGQKIGFVDIGWHGTTQKAFEKACKSMLNIEVHGYYFSLVADIVKNDTYNMKALFSNDSDDESLINAIYDNRLAFELFFSAPHESVIGLKSINRSNIKPINDLRRNVFKNNNHENIIAIQEGMIEFSKYFFDIEKELSLTSIPKLLTADLVHFATSGEWKNNNLLESITDFDCWSFTINDTMKITDQI